MTIRGCLNIAFIAAAIWCLVQGFLESWRVTHLPMYVAICGSVAACVPGRAFTAVNAIFSISSAFALFLGTLVAAGSVEFLVFGDSTETIRRAQWDACRLGLLGLAALGSGVLAARSLRQAGKVTRTES